MDVAETDAQVAMFKKFYAKYRNVDFGDRDVKARWEREFGFSDGQWDGEDDRDICELCGISVGKHFHTYCICGDCFEAIMNEYSFARDY